MKKPSKRVVVVVSLGLCVSLLCGVLLLHSKGSTARPAATVPLQKTALTSTVSATGAVASANATYVHTTLASPVKNVRVEVGDVVRAGDVLCELDTEALELDIAQQQAEINKALAAAAHEVAASERKLNNAQQNLEGDLNAAVVTAENALKSAKNVMEDASDQYDEAKKEYDEEYDDLDLDHTVTVGFCKATLREFKKAKENALTAYETARIAYQNAVDQLGIAQNEAQQSLEDYQDSVESGKLAQDTTASQIALQKLRKQLADSLVTAPASGTVTAVYAKEGAPAGGLLFVVEDTGNLLVKTKLREYDIATVREGMQAQIKSDATGDQVFAGAVERIYPAAVKGEDGATKADGNVEFETDVALSDRDTGLRIGMNVRLGIVTAQKEEVWAVPYDAVTTNEAGESIVYVARAGEKGAFTAAAVPVTTGMETDFYMEIDSPQLQEGDQVISDPTGVFEGMQVLPMPAGGEGAQAAAGGTAQENSAQDSSAQSAQASSSGGQTSQAGEKGGEEAGSASGDAQDGQGAQDSQAGEA